MKLALATLLAASLAFADPPADAPTSAHLAAGQPAPFSGRLLSDAEHVRSEKLCADDHAFRAKTDGQVMLAPMTVVAIVAGALALGAAVSAGVMCAKSPNACGLKGR